MNGASPPPAVQPWKTSVCLLGPLLVLPPHHRTAVGILGPAWSDGSLPGSGPLLRPTCLFSHSFSGIVSLPLGLGAFPILNFILDSEIFAYIRSWRWGPWNSLKFHIYLIHRAKRWFHTIFLEHFCFDCDLSHKARCGIFYLSCWCSKSFKFPDWGYLPCSKSHVLFRFWMLWNIWS